MAKWPEPKSIPQLRAFLGKVSYYRKFIEKYSHLSAPLYGLLKKEEQPEKGVDLKLSDSAKTSFYQLRQVLLEAPVRSYPDFNSAEPFIVDTDWSQEPGAIGGVLSQRQDGEERVICYGARKLTKTERNYSSNKGEILAVIHFIKSWRYYLQHRPFTLRTDHQALKWIRTMEEPRGMTLRWLETLGNHDFTVEFRAGKDHGNADALSRIDHAREPTASEVQESLDEIACINNLTYPTQISEAEMAYAQRMDADLNKVRTWIIAEHKPEPHDVRKESPALRQYHSVLECLYVDRHDLVKRAPQPGEYFTQDRLCLPRALITATIQSCHEATGGHMGMTTTKNRFQQRFFCPGAYKEVEAFISECLLCQRKRSRGKDQRHTLFSTTDGCPWQRAAIDFVGPMKPSSMGNRYWLTVKDTFTKWIEAFPTNDITSVGVARILERELFSRHGLPEQIHSDQGTQFTSEFFGELAAQLRIKNSITPAYNPKSNPVERSHRDLHIHGYDVGLPARRSTIRST